jgi:hypothetical protein
VLERITAIPTLPSELNVHSSQIELDRRRRCPRESSDDPQLAEDDPPHRVVLVVADALGHKVDPLRDKKSDGRRLVGNLPVDRRPGRARLCGVGGLQAQGTLDPVPSAWLQNYEVLMLLRSLGTNAAQRRPEVASAGDGNPTVQYAPICALLRESFR